MAAPPASITTYLLNEAVAATYGCVDGGSGVASCSGPAANGTPIKTTNVGTYNFNVTGVDHVANTDSLNHPYLASFKICALCLQSPDHGIDDGRLRDDVHRGGG